VTSTPTTAPRIEAPEPAARWRFPQGPLATVIASTIGLFVVSAVVAPGSVSELSLRAMLPLAAVTAVAAAGQTLVVQQRGIDLSVPGTMTLCAMVLAWSGQRNGLPLVVSLAVALLVAGLVGLLNGVLVAKVGIAPLIGTLAVNALAVGAMWTYSDGFSTTAPQSWTDGITARAGGLPVLAWVALLVVVVTAVVAGRTVPGRRFAAAGANPAAARAAGIHVTRHVIAAYVVAALLFGIAALLLVGYVRTTSTGLGEPYLLPVIAAVVVGGTALTGGRGHILASAVAALFLAQLAQLVVTLGAPSSVQMLVQAAAIAVAAALRGIIGSDLAHLIRRPRTH
jgi:ribose transport system permease protein